MAAGTRISVEQYFRTPTDGECELLDGELRPKPMGILDHSRVQARLRDALRQYEEAGKGEANCGDESADGRKRSHSGFPL